MEPLVALPSFSLHSIEEIKVPYGANNPFERASSRSVIQRRLLKPVPRTASFVRKPAFTIGITAATLRRREGDVKARQTLGRGVNAVLL